MRSCPEEMFANATKIDPAETFGNTYCNRGLEYMGIAFICVIVGIVLLLLFIGISGMNWGGGYPHPNFVYLRKNGIFF